MIRFTNNSEHSKNVLVHFGEGNILIDSVLNNDGNGWVILDELEDNYPIGTDFDCYSDYSTTGNCVYLRFENIESLDVLLKRLNTLRFQMAREHWEYGNEN